MIKSTDRQVYPNVYMALSCIYNSTYKPGHAAAVAEMVNQAMPVLYKLLNVEHGIKVRVGPIKARCTNGRYYSSSRSIAIDPRMSLARVMEVLCHEMVHAEQYSEGRLAWTLSRSGSYVQIWNGVASTSKATTYNAYRSLPWEAEAFNRQAGLAQKVWEILGRKPE